MSKKTNTNYFKSEDMFENKNSQKEKVMYVSFKIPENY